MALAQANALRVLSTKVTFIISIRMPASTAAHAPMLALWELSILRNNNLYAKNSGCPHQAAFFVYLSEYSTSSAEVGGTLVSGPMVIVSPVITLVPAEGSLDAISA